MYPDCFAAQQTLQGIHLRPGLSHDGVVLNISIASMLLEHQQECQQV